MNKLLKCPYESPGLDILEIDLTGGGFCNSLTVSGESNEEYETVTFNWE